MDEETAQEIRGLADDSRLLEAKVRQAILGQVQAEGSEVVGAAEIREVAEAFAWVTNPGQPHGSRGIRD
jgi:hypothetical protein